MISNCYSFTLLLQILATCSTVRAPVFSRYQNWATRCTTGKPHGSSSSGWMLCNYTVCCPLLLQAIIILIVDYNSVKGLKVTFFALFKVPNTGALTVLNCSCSDTFLVMYWNVYILMHYHVNCHALLLNSTWYRLCPCDSSLLLVLALSLCFIFTSILALSLCFIFTSILALSLCFVLASILALSLCFVLASILALSLFCPHFYPYSINVFRLRFYPRSILVFHPRSSLIPRLYWPKTRHNLRRTCRVYPLSTVDINAPGTEVRHCRDKGQARTRHKHGVNVVLDRLARTRHNLWRTCRVYPCPLSI